MPVGNASFPSLNSILPVRALANLGCGSILVSTQWGGSCKAAGTAQLCLSPLPCRLQGYLPGTQPTGDQEEAGSPHCWLFSPTLFLNLAPLLVLLPAPGLSCSHCSYRSSSLLGSASLFLSILRLQ